MFKPNSKFKIKTPVGYETFAGIQLVTKPAYVRLVFSDKTSISCSPDHAILTPTAWQSAKNLKIGDDVCHKDGHTTVVSSEFVNEPISLYDVVGVPTQQFYANNIVSHNCAFLGSENTLISPSKIAALYFATPVSSSHDGLDIYEEPNPNSVYAITVDTSRGMGEDYHAFSVIDCTAAPYKLVAKFRNNSMSYQVLPHVIKRVGDMYNEALVLVEINDLGQAVAELLHEELEYGNIMTISQRGKKGQKADGGFGGGSKSQFGVRMSHTIKKIGCSILKDLVEADKLLIQDFDIVSEFSTFVSGKTGYEATEGYHDDLVSTLIIFSWLTTQNYFKDYTNIDIRKKLYEDQIKKIEEEVMPFGFSSTEEVDETYNDSMNLADERPPIERVAKEKELWKD